MLVVAVPVWTNRRAGLPRVSLRVGLSRWWGAVAGATGLVLRVALVAAVAVRGVAGLLLVAYGCWLAYPPAGFVVAGVGLLADRVADGWPRQEDSDA